MAVSTLFVTTASTETLKLSVQLSVQKCLGGRNESYTQIEPFSKNNSLHNFATLKK